MNVCYITGNVSEIHFSITEKRQDEAASFTIFIDRDTEHTTLVRVNCYGSLVSRLREFRVTEGDYLLVQAELMNRFLKNKQIKAMELKAIDFKKLNAASEKREFYDRNATTAG